MVTKKWIKSMIKDEEEGIKSYSGKKGFKTQAAQEKSHLRKLKNMLKK